MSLNQHQEAAPNVLERLREDIRRLRRNGTEERLPAERQLAESMQVSRRSVRLAMDILESEGLVWRQQGKGTFIGRRPSLAGDFADSLANRINPLELMEARILVEPLLARLAAMRCTEDDIETIQHLARKTSAVTGFHPDWEKWDSAFHQRIAECAGNELMLGLFEIIRKMRHNSLWLRTRGQARTTEQIKDSLKDHARIANAIASRNSIAAETAMREHLSGIYKSLQAIVSGEKGEAVTSSSLERTVDE